MRRTILALSLAALVAIVGVPLGAAFTFERAPLVVPDAVLIEAAAAPVLMTPWPEAGTLAVIGALLLGVASLVRRRS